MSVIKSGPGVLIAAAFIGPGTVTICTLAGVEHGFSLLWVMLLAIITTVVLQEMAARIGLVSGMGLAKVLKSQIKIPVIRIGILLLVLAAILIGNTAYEAGNIGGATLGVEAVFGTEYSFLYPLIIGVIAFILLYTGSYRILEGFFTGLVILMSVSFILAAILTGPDLIAIGKGLLMPVIPEDSLFTILALVGTTVVPYNLFLHASLVNEKWTGAEALMALRKDTLIAVGIGGIISMAVIVAAAAMPGSTVNSGADLARGLAPLYGEWARYFMGLGLFAAGITSAITAPLAAAYVAQNCFDWDSGLKDWRFRMVWMGILLFGVAALSLDFTPIEIIKFAQASNGLVLPLIVILILLLINKRKVMGNYINSRAQNFLALLILLLILVLGTKTLISVFNFS